MQSIPQSSPRLQAAHLCPVTRIAPHDPRAFPCVLLLPSLTASVHATEWVLHPAGTDKPTCTRAASCTSLQHMFPKARPGDTVLLRGGTYRQSLRLGSQGPVQHGTPARRITMAGAPGERVLLVGSPAPPLGRPWSPRTRPTWRRR